MKTLFKISSGIVLASMLVIPLMTFALAEQVPDSCTRRSSTVIEDCPSSGAIPFATVYTSGVTGAICCLMDTIYNITNWIFLIFLAV